MPFLDVPTPDGRTLEVLVEGDPDGAAWVFHSGSPSAAVPYPPFDEAARVAGLRMLTWSRPGYGASTPRAHPPGGPRFADDVVDTVTVLDHLGVGEFVTTGWSGGGPRALGCAALLPERCRAATSLAGVAPYDAVGLDWSAGMAPDNVAEYAAAAQGPDAYAAYLTREFLPVLAASADDLAEAMGDLLTPVDVAALTPTYAAHLAASFAGAGRQGVVGVRDDGLAAVAPWGFDPTAITVPVAIWQGRQDAMVPFAHGRWLATHVPGARAHLLDDEGHLSIGTRIGQVLAELRELAGWDAR